jgi:hypothetical protein
MSDANLPPPETPEPSNNGAENTSSSSSSGPTPNWRDLRREERDARRQEWRRARDAWRSEHGWHGWNAGPPVGAIVLIAVGVLFLLGNFGFHLSGHWWAALILIPAVSLLVAAIRFYRADGPSPRVVGPAIGGFVLLAIALSLFFGFHGAGFFWPVILIAVGAVFIARRNWWMRHQPPKA